MEDPVQTTRIGHRRFENETWNLVPFKIIEFSLLSSFQWHMYRGGIPV